MVPGRNPQLPVDSRNCPADCPNRPVGSRKLLHKHLSAAIAEKSPTLAEYGLDKADATALAKETADYEAIIADPSVAISRRKSLTSALRPRFREVAELLAKMDRHGPPPVRLPTRRLRRFGRTASNTALSPNSRA